MNDKVAIEEMQAWIAKETKASNELEAKSKELIAFLQSSERLFFKDLVTFLILKASQAEEDLEILRELVLTLVQELDASRQTIEECHEQIAFDNKLLATSNSEMLLLTKELQDSQKVLQDEREARQYLGWKLLKRSEIVNSHRQEMRARFIQLHSQAAKTRSELAQIRAECDKTIAEFTRIRSNSALFHPKQSDAYEQ